MEGLFAEVRQHYENQQGASRQLERRNSRKLLPTRGPKRCWEKWCRQDQSESAPCNGATRRSHNHRIKAGQGGVSGINTPTSFSWLSDLLLKLPVHLIQTGRQTTGSPVIPSPEVLCSKAQSRGKWVLGWEQSKITKPSGGVGVLWTVHPGKKANP